MDTTFTPFASLGGGILIGLAAVLMMGLLGRIMGATGIVSGALMPSGPGERGWRIATILGMMTGPLVYRGLTGEMPAIQVSASTPMLIGGGLIVGVGATLGSGCTSGHGVCGLARLSPRSLTATLTFMASTAATVFVVRHVMGG